MMRWSRSLDEHRATVWTAWATFPIPLTLATLIGLATAQPLGFYIGMAVISGLPVVASMSRAAGNSTP